MKDLSQQLDFILEIDKLKAVYRRTLVQSDNNRFENSAEHSWHIALMAHVLSPYAEEPVNISRITLMLLIHDIVEIDAGDTFAFDQQSILAQQSDKEIEAANRIFGLLPESQASMLLSLWQEFECAETPDARFAKAMDRLLPLLQNMRNNGGSWAKHTVYRQQVIDRNKYLKASSPKLWQFVLEQIDIATENGWLISD